MGFNCCVEKLPGIRPSPKKPTSGCPEKLPEIGHVLSPWCCIRFVLDNRTVTVGNHSMPSDGNTAVIKSFEYGHTDGFTLRVVMEDQKGGSLEAVADHLVKNWRESKADKYVVRFQFGWAKAGCTVPLPPVMSDCYEAFNTNFETSYSQGKFFVELTASDLMKVAQEGATEAHIGTEDQKVCLTHAINQLLCQSKDEPNIEKVSFLKLENGVRVPVGFEKWESPCTKFEGPRGVWRAEGEDKLQVIKRWMFDYRTENKKGWVAGWDEKEGKHLIFWEDRVPVCESRPAEWWQQNCAGKFTVNAGRDSAVIEFNPRMKWSFDHGVNVQGGTDNLSLSPFEDTEEGGKNTKSTGRYECPALARPKQKGYGKAMQSTPTQNQMDKEMKQAPEEHAKAAEANMKADMRLMPVSIEANLVIVGDPTLVDMCEIMGGKTVQIKMINPFFLTGANNRYEWLAFPPENYVVRNSAWLIKGCTHKIEAGNYTTTLNLQLASPGVDGAPGLPLGLSSDGYVPRG